MSVCTNRCPNPSAPAGWSREALESHPRWREILKPGAQCTLDEGHEGPHRNPGLIWHDPPVLYVGGEPFVAPPDDPVVLEWSD